MSAVRHQRKLPWLSLLLLVATYATFGRFVAFNTAEPSWQWAGAGLTAAISLAFLDPIRLLEFCFGGWLQSDRSAAFSIISLALALVFAARWLNWSVLLLFLVAAETLASLDLRNAGCNRWAALIIQLGLGLGSYWLGLQIEHSDTTTAVARFLLG